MLLLIIPDHRSSKSILTGKLFEYLAAGKAILCIGPVERDAAEVIENTSSGCTIQYKDADSIGNFILQNFQIKDQSGTQKTQFSRRNIAKYLTDLLYS